VLPVQLSPGLQMCRHSERKGQGGKGGGGRCDRMQCRLYKQACNALSSTNQVPACSCCQAVCNHSGEWQASELRTTPVIRPPAKRQQSDQAAPLTQCFGQGQPSE
jgi:hypothetical protein